MAYAADHLDFIHAAPQTHTAAGRGVFRRIFDAIFDSRLRRAEQDIAAYLARSGGRLTDSIERELMERVSRSAFGEPRR